MLALYSRALDELDRVSRWTIVGASGAMITVVTVQVLLRYAFNSSIDWSDEVSRLLFVWCMFLAIPLGIREGAHVGIELLVVHVPAVPRALLAKACALVAAAMMAVVFWQAVTVAWGTWDEMMQTLRLSANWFMVPVAFAAAHSFLHLVQLLWRDPVRTVQIAE
jgi:TRAP-type C4-dicarboxylate transport system permease small subunit